MFKKDSKKKLMFKKNLIIFLDYSNLNFYMYFNYILNLYLFKNLFKM